MTQNESMTEELMLIASYNPQEPNWERPDSLRWSDGSPATMADFARRDRSTVGSPEIVYDASGRKVAVEVGMSVR